MPAEQYNCASFEPSENHICGVMITYYPNREVVTNLLALLLQVRHVVVVDNGSRGAAKETVNTLSNLPGVTLLLNSNNLGIAAALNRGIEFADSMNFRWVITLDQDSLVSPGMVAHMCASYLAYPRNDRILLVAPKFLDSSTGHLASYAISDATTCDYGFILVTMTSGNLVSVVNWRAVGRFMEELFIDYVDFEFCLRGNRLGYKLLECPLAVLNHKLGLPTQHGLFGKVVSTTNHNAVRRYYSARNRTWLYRRYIVIHPAWVIMDAVAMIKEWLKILFFEKHRIRKGKAVIYGIYHGLSGRLGMVPEHVAKALSADH